MPETAFKGSPLAKARAHVAVAHRKRDPQGIEDANRDFATEKIAHYVTRVLAEAPPLTQEQRTRLAELLRPARKPAPDRKVAAQARLTELESAGGSDAA
jgi:hypothetical protein